MIIVKIIGGLGNQLFQYAFGKAIEKKLGKNVYYDISEFSYYDLRNFELHHFNVELKFASKESERELNNFKNRLLFRISRILKIEELVFKYLSYYREHVDNKPININRINNDIYLDGYWQSENYFLEIKDIIYRELSIKTELSIKNQNQLKEISLVNSISLHIRRGDYITNNRVSKIYETCSLEYYQKACDYISDRIENPVFFIFSDDIEWAKSNLRNQYNNIFVDANCAQSAIEDLRLMSSCNHHIIANSTFSWWGAWLNQNQSKIVIAPKVWFVDQYKNFNDPIPIGWIRI